MRGPAAVCACAALLCAAGVPSEVAADPPTSSGWANAWRDRVDAGAVVTVEGAVGRRAQKAEFVVEPEVDVTLTDELDLTVIGRFRADGFDRLEPGRPHQDEISPASRRWALGNQAEAELREFYVTTAVGDTWLTLGKQQIVWGKADGLKVLDVVNPQDFREFILDSFDESRIPLWSAKAEIPVGEWQADVVWIPDRTYHDLAAPGAVYAFTSPKLVPPPPPGVPVTLRSPRRPGRFFADSDAGVRFSRFWNGWDVTFNYLYHYHDVPVFRRTITPTGILIQPEYERTHLVGGTFSNAFGDWTVRGEAGYSIDRTFSVADPTDADGVAQADELGYVLGLDYFGWADMIVSAQMFQNLVTDTPPGLVRDGVDTMGSALVRRDFRNDTVHAEVLLLQDINHGDGLARPKLTYDVDDNLTVSCGADFFYGTPRGFFGQFDQNDRVVIGAEYAF